VGVSIAIVASLRVPGKRALRASGAFSEFGDDVAMPGLGQYLLETGYAWPLVGLLLAFVILWRRGFFSSKRNDMLALEGGGMSSRGANISLPPPRQESRDFETGSQSQYSNTQLAAPPQLAQYPRAQSQSQLLALPADVQFQNAQQATQASQLTAQDFNALLDRSRHDEQLREGVACIKSVFQTQVPDLGTRMGVMTARKVNEIAGMLIQELEESLVSKMGFMASLFHSWRAEATLLKVGRTYEDDFSAQKGDWENYLTDQRRNCEEKLLSSARKAAQQKERLHQSITLVTDQWCNGDTKGLQIAITKAWHDLTHKQHLLRVQRQRVHTIVICWAEGNRKGTMHMCLKNWHGCTSSQKELRAKSAEHSDEKVKMQNFLDETNAKHEAMIDAAMQEVDIKKARAHKDVQMILAKWEMGDRHGSMSTVLMAWSQYNRKIRQLRRQSQSVHQSMLNFLEGDKRSSMQGSFMAWRNFSQHQKELHSATSKLEDMLNGEKSRRDQEDGEKQTEQERKIEAARSAVALVAKKWMLGETTGLIKEVLEVWSNFVFKRGQGLKQRESVHTSLMKFIEGEKRGGVHVCFIHWKADAKDSKLRIQHLHELKNEQKVWEDLLTDEHRRTEDLMVDHRTEQEKRKDQAEAVVKYALSRWDLGDDMGLLSSVLKGWAGFAQAAAGLARKRQAVHMALQKFMEGDAKAVIHSCFLNWQHWTKHALQATMGDQRLADEKARFDAFLENTKAAHADELDLKMTEEERRKAKAHESLELMMRQWMKGDVMGLASEVCAAWRKLKDRVKDLNWRKQSVHNATMRWLEGDIKGTAHTCLLNWKHWAKMEVIWKSEVYERDRKITQLEDRTRGLLGKEQSRLIKYAAMLGTVDDPMLLLMIVAGWHVHAGGVKGLERERAMDAELQEMQRIHEINALKKKHLAAATFEAMGCKNNNMVLMDHFVGWLQSFKEDKQERLHKLINNKTVNKYADFLLENYAKQDSESLRTLYFAEWLKEARHLLHTRVRENQEGKLKDHHANIQDLTEDNDRLQEELAKQFKKNDEISATLLKELQLKEELTRELQEANKQHRDSLLKKPRNLDRGSASRESSVDTATDTATGRRIRDPSSPGGWKIQG